MEYQEIVIDITQYYSNSSAFSSDFGDGAFLLKGDNEFAYIVNNKLHRDDGPARIFLYPTTLGMKCYFIFYKHGKAHNEDGPALIAYYMNKLDMPYHSYYLDGIFLTQLEWEQQIATKLYW